MPLFGPPNIEKMTASRDVKGLIKVLKGQTDPQLRAQAVQALMQIGDGQAIEPLYEARNDDNPGVRALAAIALGYFGDERAVDGLISTLYIGQETSVKLLGLLGGSQAVGPLSEVVDNYKAPDAMKSAAIEMLVHIGDARAIRPLVHSLVFSNTDRPAVNQALKSFGEAAIPPLMEKLAKGQDIFKDRWESVREPLEGAFLVLGAPAREALVESLDQSPNFELLKDKVAILKQMDCGLDFPQANAAEVLVRGDKEEIAALGPEAEGVLSTLWKDAGGENWLNALIRIWGAEAGDRLLEMLQDGSLGYTAQDDAIKALGELGDERAIPILTSAYTTKGGAGGLEPVQLPGSRAGHRNSVGLLRIRLDSHRRRGCPCEKELDAA